MLSIRRSQVQFRASQKSPNPHEAIARIRKQFMLLADPMRPYKVTDIQHLIQDFRILAPSTRLDYPDFSPFAHLLSDGKQTGEWMRTMHSLIRVQLIPAFHVCGQEQQIDEEMMEHLKMTLDVTLLLSQLLIYLAGGWRAYADREHPDFVQSDAFYRHHELSQFFDRNAQQITERLKWSGPSGEAVIQNLRKIRHRLIWIKQRLAKDVS